MVGQLLTSTNDMINQMQTTIHSSLNSFGKLHSQWHDLLTRTPINHLFYTSEFIFTWWQAFGQGKLHLITISDENKLIALAPLYQPSDHKSTNSLQLIGSHQVTDYADILVDADYLQSALTQLIEHLSTFQNFKLISVPKNSPTLKILTDLFNSTNNQINLQQQDVCPIISLPATWEDYLTNLDRKQRHEIRRKWRKIDSEVNTEFEIITKPTQIDINDFIKLHQLSSQEKAEFWNRSTINFFTTLINKTAEKNWCKLFFLKINNSRTATSLIFDYQNTYYLYNSGYDPGQFAPLSPGQVLTFITIRNAIENSKTKYDFLRGNEKYKFRLGGVEKEIYDVRKSASLS